MTTAPQKYKRAPLKYHESGGLAMVPQSRIGAPVPQFYLPQTFSLQTTKTATRIGHKLW